jgi:hypothetical protein
VQPARNAAYAAQILRVRDRVDAFAQARFATGSYRDADLERFVAQVVPVALAGRRQVSALTDAHLAQVMSAKLGKSVRPSGPVDVASLRGVDVAEVYGRPFKTVWWKLSTGLVLDAAVAAGRARLTDIVMGDMQLAKTTTAQQSLRAGGFERFKRVVSYTARTCDLCPIAAENTYSTADLMPIHPGCNCGVEPLEGDGPTSTDMQGVAIHTHGELGPVLTVAGQHFDGPSVAA